MPLLPIGEPAAMTILADAASVDPIGERKCKLRLLLDYLEASAIVVRENGIITQGTPLRADARILSRQGFSQAQSVIITTIFSHPSGKVLKFNTALPAGASRWQSGLSPYFEVDAERFW